jgi:hypothetical protein
VLHELQRIAQHKKNKVCFHLSCSFWFD